MEGGYLPWKIQRIEHNSPDLDSYGKPLPPPPPGLCWERLDDGSWTLKVLRELVKEDAEWIEVERSSILEHTVLSEDTLQGISLRYRVSVTELRRLNMFSGNSIQCKKTLRIPVEPGMQIRYQPDTRNVTIQKFRNITSEGVAEACLYLEDNQWDITAAISAWKEDTNWSEDHNITHASGFSKNLRQQTVRPNSIEHRKIVAPTAVIVADDSADSHISLRNVAPKDHSTSNQPLLG